MKATYKAKTQLIFKAGLIVCMILAAPIAQAQDERLAAFYKNQVDPHFALVRAGADAAAKSMGAAAPMHFAPTRPNNLAEQLSQIEDVTIRRPDSILFMAVDPRGVVPAIEKVNAAGIPVVNFNDRVAGGDYVSFVGADDFTLAAETARYLFNTMDGKGSVIIIEGVKGAFTNDERVRGFQAALAEFPDVKLLASQPANYQRLQALQVTENLIQSHPDIDGILAATDAMAMGAIEAIEATGAKDVKVIGINGVPEAIEAIKQGRLLAAGEFDGHKIGCIAATAAIRNLRGEPVPESIILKGIVIDSTNLGPWDVPVEERQCPKWEDVVNS